MRAPPAADEQECVESYLKEYEDYDHSLHAVASWREVFGMKVYEVLRPSFDWFPEIPNPIAQHTPLRPDFAVFLEPDYELIGEIKPSLPLDEKGFDDDLLQLASYCKIEKGRDDQGRERTIERRDVILSLSRACNSVQIARRILACLNDPKHPYKPARNVIVMDHVFLQTHGHAQFQIQRIPIDGNGEFQQKLLYKHICEESRPINMPVERTMQHISQHIIMNDTPKSLFMMVLLWSLVFPPKFAATSRKSAAGRAVIGVRARELSTEINQAFFGGQVRLPQSAIDEALRNFEAIGFSTHNRKTGEYLIEFRRIMRVDAVGQPARDYPECARFFATKLCRSKGKPSPGSAPAVIEQPSLFPED